MTLRKKSSVESLDQTLLRSPSSAARATLSFDPSTIISIARDLPTSRARRCVPPVPGSTPSPTSGSPIWCSPARDTHVARQCYLETTADRMPVQRGDDELRRLL